MYVIDELARNAGHEVLRLPPYHCQFNPIELIWAQVKGDVKRNNSNNNQTVKRVEDITRKAINKITAGDWRKCIRHTRRVEEEYRRKDIAYVHLTESFVINIDSNESSETSDSSESDTDE